LDYATSLDSSSAEANRQHFESLKWNPQLRRFFKDFHHLIVGKKIAEGSDIYEAGICDDENYVDSLTYNHVMKVVKGDVPLQSFQSQWPLGLLFTQSKSKELFDSPLILIWGD